MYREWAEGHNNKIKNILNGAREEHTSAVKKRIESVQGLGGVVDVTKNLFAVSKVCFVYRHGILGTTTNAGQETAELEAQAYELEQKTALAAEAKSVLESWVRYEGQVKTRQQKELADTIMSRIDGELKDPKVLKRILDQSVTDVERKFDTVSMPIYDTNDPSQESCHSRNRADQWIAHHCNHSVNRVQSHLCPQASSFR